MKPALPLDFNALVAGMKEAGAFNAYEKPLGQTDAATVEPHYQNPHYPGESSYGVAYTQINWRGAKIPQDLVDAQKQSLGDAIQLYMPQAEMGQWMHEFFAGDFLHSPPFKALTKELPKIQDSKNNELDNKFTLKLDHKQRMRNDRRIFTETESDLTLQVCEKLPALPIAVIAFQASFIGYLEKLNKAIGSSKTLNDAERKQGQKVVKDLTRVWGGANFYQNIMVSLGVHYYKNHEQNLGEPPTAEDFNQAMRFIMKNGSFRRTVEYNDHSGSVHITCPAQRIISQSSAVALEETQQQPQSGMASQLGVALHHIYRETDRQVSHDTARLAKAKGDLEKLFRRAILPKPAASR